MPTPGPRLLALASHVLPDAPMADVGTDHGLLPRHLLDSGRVPRAIAIDRRPEPLAKAQALGLECRLGDGLEALQPGEVATVVIAGMGGWQIRRVLDRHPDVAASAGRLVLSPHRNKEHVTGWLQAHGWRWTEHTATERGRDYPILVAEREERDGASDVSDGVRT